MIRNRLLAVTLTVILVALNGVPAFGATDTRSYAYQWTEGKLTTVEFWNDPSRVTLEYAANPWTQGQFAAERAYVNAARIVMRDGLKVTDLINSLGRKGTVRVHGAESNSATHHDFPPHFHVFYLYVNNGNWQEINSHAYTSAQGKVTSNFVIPQICGGGSSYQLAADQWLDIKDETCTALWQQRYTASGDYEIRRNASGPTYTLRGKSVTGDLASVDVLVNGQLRWNVTTTEYSGTKLRLVAKMTDYQTGAVTTETWQGDPTNFNTLVSHTTTNGTPATPAPTAPPTQSPAPTAKPTQSPVPTVQPTQPPAPTNQPTQPPAATAQPTQPATGTTVSASPSIAAYDDDGYQDGTSFTNDNTTLWVGDNRDVNASYAGLRFAGVTIPRGATIQSASLRMYSNAASSTAMKVNVYGEASANSGKFSASSLPSNRARTSAVVPYAPTSGWAANTWYSVDVTPVIREIINRGDWTSGNALSLLIKGTSGNQGNRRGIKSNTSWDHSNVPQLVIKYASGAVATQPPAPTAQPTQPPAPTAQPTQPPAATAHPTAQPTQSPAPTAQPTRPPATGSATFAVIGDYGGGDSNGSNEGSVANLVKSWNPSYVVTVGDDWYPWVGGSNGTQYDLSTGKYYCSFLAGISTPGTNCGQPGGASVNRFFPALGNHEYNAGTTNGLPTTYTNYFSLPGSGVASSNTSGNERYYDFVQGPVHFFVLNSNNGSGQEPDGVTSTSKQAMWLKARLAGATEPWKVVVLHHAPYTSGSTHGSSAWMQWPFAQWGANVVLSGHEHIYERVQRDGIVYFVNGLGGASRYTCGTRVSGSQICYDANYGAQRVVATNSTLDFSFVTADGVTQDSYHLDKSGTTPVPTVQPTQTPAPTVQPTQTTAPTAQPTQPPSSGQVFYVAPNGNDSNPGTLAAPWRTIAKANSTLRAGQTVFVRAGTYAEQVKPTNNGTASAWITFAAYPGETVILDGARFSVSNWSGLVDVSKRAYITVKGFTAQNSAYAGLFASGANNIVLQGNHTLHSYTSGIGVWSSNNIVLDGNDVENSNYGGGNEAISLGGTGYFEIKHNKVHNPAATSSQPLKEGIDCKQGSHDGSVHDNEIYDLQKVALYADAYDQHTYNLKYYANKIHDVRMGITLASEAGGLLENVQVYNNLIWNVYYAGLRTFGQVETASHPMQNISYLNNTVYNAGGGINVSNNQITNFVVRNNIAPSYDIPVSGVVQDHNLTSSNPGYVNPAGGDFRLTAGSAAIDKGSASGAPATDYAGTTRPQGAAIDIGAYEYR